MKDYLLLIRGGDASTASLSEEETEEYMQKWGLFMGQLASLGNLGGGLPLGTDGRLMTKNGVSKEVVLSKDNESIGGYLILKANDYNHAVELSKSCPVFEHNGSLEIREALPMN